MSTQCAAVVCTGMICVTLIVLSITVKVRVKHTVDVEVK